MSTALDSAAALPRIAPPDARPIRLLPPAPTSPARRAAHRAMDRLWKGRDAMLTRDEAYDWVAAALGIGRERMHVSWLSEEGCGRLVAILKPMEEER